MPPGIRQDKKCISIVHKPVHKSGWSNRNAGVGFSLSHLLAKAGFRFFYTNAYDVVYKWFDYLKSKGHFINGFFLMPNHLHAIIAAKFYYTVEFGVYEIVSYNRMMDVDLSL